MEGDGGTEVGMEVGIKAGNRGGGKVTAISHCRNLLIPTSSDIRELVHLGHRGRQVNEYIQ